MTPDFVAEIDRARGELGRSQFFRDAIYEKLERAGIVIPREKVIAPDRAGKATVKRKPKMAQDVVNSRPTGPVGGVYIAPEMGTRRTPRKIVS